jgi:hypothetical protein
MKKYFMIGLCIVSFIMLAGIDGCDKSADKELAKQTEIVMREANKQVGMPNIVNFQQRKVMKTIYELTDKENLICYAYLKSDYSGKLIFIGKCMGYGVPFSAQYTNPQKIADYRSGGYAILPQPDPNGLFMPTSSSATWLMMIDPKTNKPRPVYIEPEIVVSPFALQSEEGKQKGIK